MEKDFGQIEGRPRSVGMQKLYHEIDKITKEVPSNCIES